MELPPTPRSNNFPTLLYRTMLNGFCIEHALTPQHGHNDAGFKPLTGIVYSHRVC